jgi:hypothetical protein
MAKYGPDFYRNIGRKGGTNGHDGGFAARDLGKDGLTGPERAKIYGSVGGKVSRRGRKGLELTEEDRQKIAAARHEASIKAVKYGIDILTERLSRLQDGEERATVNA